MSNSLSILGSRGFFRTACLAFGIALFAVAMGAGASAHPTLARHACEGLIACIGVVSLRLLLRPPQRVALTGVAIGVGLLTAPLGSASNGLLAAAVVVSMPPLTPRRSMGSLAWTKSIWLAGVVCVLLGILLTVSRAHVSASVILGMFAVCAASLWMFAEVRESEGWNSGSGLEIVQTAGVVAGISVIISYVSGHPLVPVTAHMLQNAIVQSGTVRASGVFTSPNEAAIVLSAAALATLLRVSIKGPAGKYGGLPTIGSLLIIVSALLATGSRGGVLALVAGGIVIAIASARGRPRLVAGLIGIGAVGIWVGSILGTFSGRSLNVLTSSDAASRYRHLITQRVIDGIDWTQLHGYGFVNGNALAANPVSGEVSHLDEGWLYLILALGLASLVGFGLILLTGAIRAYARQGFLGLAGIVWVLVLVPSENLFVLGGPCICAILLVTAPATKVQ